MTLNSRGLAFVLALIIAIIPTIFLYLSPDVSNTIVSIAFLLSLTSGFIIIRVMAEFLFFREINNIYKALENIQHKELSAISKREVQNEGPSCRISSTRDENISLQSGAIIVIVLVPCSCML